MYFCVHQIVSWTHTAIAFEHGITRKYQVVLFFFYSLSGGDLMCQQANKLSVMHTLTWAIVKGGGLTKWCELISLPFWVAFTFFYCQTHCHSFDLLRFIFLTQMCVLCSLNLILHSFPRCRTGRDSGVDGATLFSISFFSSSASVLIFVPSRLVRSVCWCVCVHDHV